MPFAASRTDPEIIILNEASQRKTNTNINPGRVYEREEKAAATAAAATAAAAKLQSGLTLRDPVDCSLPGSSVHGIFQARVLEWGAIKS